jgi:glycosyltransferase involved in cell wall biosynthesis
MTCKQKNTSKKIAIIWQADYPWDVRIEKQIISFSEQGWESHIICRNLSDKPIYENKDNLHILRFRNFFKNNKVLALLSFPININPFWRFHIEKSIKKINPDLIIVRDLPLAPLAINTGKKHKIPVITDIAEHYPAMIRELPDRYGKNPISRFLLYGLKWFEFIEKITVRKSNSVIIVTQEQKERFIISYSINPDKIAVVSNTPDIKPENPLAENKELKKVIKIIYAGKLDEEFRGLETVIETAFKLQNMPVKFIIAGCGREEENLKTEIKALGLNNVELTGYFSQNNLFDLLKEADIGIVPHLKSDLTDYTIPNKLFDYMSEALPVISSDINPVKRVIKETNCGWVYESGSSEALKNLILEILKDKNSILEKGRNGSNAVKNKYNWTKDSEILVETVKKLIES